MNIKGYKTVAFNAIMGGIALVVALNPELTETAPTAEEVTGGIAQVEAAIAAITMVGNWVLRAFTSTKIFTKE